MNNFFEELKRYFETTPQSKVLEDWAKSEEFDNIGSTIEEFLCNSRFYQAYTNDSSQWCMQNIKNQLSPKFTSGFFINSNS